MRKISYYLIFAVVIGGLLASFWAYQKYFKGEDANFLFFEVERGEIQETVKVRGEVVSQKEFDLAFPFSGIVEKVFAREGQSVNKGGALMKLDTRDQELEIERLESVLLQRRANLAKLIAGSTEEDINISKTKVENSKISLEEAKKNLIDKLQDAHTKSDDAVRRRVDQFFSNPRGSNPKIDFSVTDSRLKADIEWNRFLIEDVFNLWQSLLESLEVSGDIDSYIGDTNRNLDQIKSFLDKVSLAINGAGPSSSITQDTIDAWKADVSTARTNVNAAVTNLSAAEEKLRTAESSLVLAENELIFKEAGARSEDIEIAEAQIKETENQIAVVEEKIRKSFLYASAPVKITKIWLEEGELFRPGQTAVSLAAFGHKIQADVSELEIGKVREVNGNEVDIYLDAFPDKEFKGKVLSIESKEIIKEGDKYYRVNVHLEEGGVEVRSGMSADLVINISFKENALKIPEFVVYQKDGKDFVEIFENGEQFESEIETGISDGESIEIVKGLSEGQTIMVSTD